METAKTVEEALASWEGTKIMAISMIKIIIHAAIYTQGTSIFRPSHLEETKKKSSDNSG